jgi:hypothetical protein
MTTSNTTNQVANTQENANQIIAPTVQGSYQIVQDAITGKFSRQAIYSAYSSIVPETRAEKIAMMKLLEDDDIAQPMKDYVGTQITVANVIHQPYDRVNDENGNIEYGVLTYLITEDDVAYVTSSKSVYNKTKRFFLMFGQPAWTKEDDITVQVVLKKGREHKYVDIDLIG